VLMSNARRQQREIALQILFLWDAQESDDAALAEQAAQSVGAEAAVSRRGIEMARAAWGQKEIADAWMERLAPQWPPRRQPGVDRAILRMSLWELTDGKTPPKVVLDEAIELARAFSTELSPSFVNGVLDAALREHVALTSGMADVPVAAPTESTAPSDLSVTPELTAAAPAMMAPGGQAMNEAAPASDDSGKDPAP
jgi:transcription antitermination protein NusB